MAKTLQSTIILAQNNTTAGKLSAMTGLCDRQEALISDFLAAAKKAVELMEQAGVGYAESDLRLAIAKAEGTDSHER